MRECENLKSPYCAMTSGSKWNSGTVAGIYAGQSMKIGVPLTISEVVQPRSKWYRKWYTAGQRVMLSKLYVEHENERATRKMALKISECVDGHKVGDIVFLGVKPGVPEVPVYGWVSEVNEKCMLIRHLDVDFIHAVGQNTIVGHQEFESYVSQ